MFAGHSMLCPDEEKVKGANREIGVPGRGEGWLKTLRLQATAFRMPAEWEAHEATWLAWPHELTDWPGKFAPIPWAFAEIVRHLARVERVFLLVENRESEARVRAILVKAGVGA